MSLALMFKKTSSLHMSFNNKTLHSFRLSSFLFVEAIRGGEQSIQAGQLIKKCPLHTCTKTMAFLNVHTFSKDRPEMKKKLYSVFFFLFLNQFE